MSDWQMLVTSALLGVERRPLQLSPDAPLAGQQATDDAQTLLRAAAVLALQRRAGYTPSHDDSPLPPAPEETLPCCSYRSMHHLAQLLNEPTRYATLLDEWLGKAARKGLRVPHGMLPSLFDVVVRWKHHRLLATLVGGERGRWLAAQNPAWKSIAEVNLDEARVVLTLTLVEVNKDDIERALKDAQFQTPNQLLELLLAERQIVAADAVETVLDRMMSRARGGNLQPTMQLWMALASAIAPDLLFPAILRMRQAKASGSQGLDYPLSVLEFRAEMLRELDRD